MNWILLAHVFTTFFMCGLCWFVQLVHYPLFKAMSPADFPAYQRKNFATGVITVPVMTIELCTGLWLLYANYGDIFLANMILLGLIWASTFLFQVPTHLRLLKTPRLSLFNRLIRTNWIRTISWTARSGLLVYLLLHYF